MNEIRDFISLLNRIQITNLASMREYVFLKNKITTFTWLGAGEDIGLEL